MLKQFDELSNDLLNGISID